LERFALIASKLAPAGIGVLPDTEITCGSELARDEISNPNKNLKTETKFSSPPHNSQ
jgi:hypothetical protein